MTRRMSGRETWHRLLNWDNGQTAAERLSAQILSMEKFEGVDPTHPLGGRDGKRDLIITKNNEIWVGSVYFPRGQKKFNDIKDKFLDDLKGVEKNNAVGYAFVTNQELRLAEREELKKQSVKKIDVFHLERIASILNQPKGYGIRLEFLDIEMSKEEQISALAERDEIISRLLDIYQKDKSKSVITNKTKSIEVTPELIDNYTNIFGYGSKIHFCSNCGFGYKVNNPEYFHYSLSFQKAYSITCPKCGNLDYYRLGI